MITSRAYPDTAVENPPGLDQAPGWADAAELDQFDDAVRRYLAGDLDPEAFRRIRLWHGVYGMRQLTDVYMVRVKIPGGALTAAAADALADVAESWSRGWGHLTTRQNVQFHFVAVADVPSVLRRFAAAGLTTREACGDAVRNVTACPLAGVCRREVADVNAATEAIARHFLRNPVAQDLPRKFKIAVSGCASDCALAGIHDLGIIATERDGRTGFRLVVGGGLGTSPHAAQELEPFTGPADLLVTAEAVLRAWDAQTPDRTKRTRARLKYLVARLGIEVFRAQVLAQREQLRRSPGYPDPPPAASLPARTPRIPRPVDVGITASDDGYARWQAANVTGQRQPGRYAAYATVRLGDVTAAQFRALAAAAGEFGITWRTTVRQNLVARNLLEGDLPRLHTLLAAAGLGDVAADHAADVLSCPGTETCNLALTASRGAATAITSALRAAGLGDAPLAINVTGCPNSCGQPQMADIGLSGLVRRVGRDEAPGYRIMLGGGVTPGGVTFGRYIAKVHAKRAPEAVTALVARYVRERLDGEGFGAWAERAGIAELRAWLEPFDNKRTRQQAPDLYTDWGETEPFEVILGRGECAS